MNWFWSVSICVAFLTIACGLLFSSLFSVDDLPEYKLAIGILSARENFAERNAVRSTWLSALNHQPLRDKVFAAFIVTNKDCDVPLKYRKTVFDCDEAKLPEKDARSKVYTFWQSTEVIFPSKYPSEYVTVAMDFTVVYDIIITEISTVNIKSIIQLWDLVSDKLVMESLPLGNNDVIQKRKIDHYLLPRGFVGSVVVFCPISFSCLKVNISSSYAGVEISPIIRYSVVADEFPDHILPTSVSGISSPATFSYQIADSTHIENATMRTTAYENKLLENFSIQKKLEAERLKYQDIISLTDLNFEPLIESYRNLPRKLVAFYLWCQRNIRANYVMKIDDDSYVDVENVIKNLLDIEASSKLRKVYPFWLGRFRHDVPVARYGKWSEYQYSAFSYPSFACGSGYVLSSSIVQFLVENSRRLRFYQGEDVSMGIWLSAIDVTYIENTNWKCDDSCNEDMVVSAQHSPEDLRRLWQNKLLCSEPCSCD